MNLFLGFKKRFVNRSRRGFILYIVCALAIGLFILIAGFNKFKSGAVLQLSKTATQEKMVVVAQAAINESLASVKAGINDNKTPVGSAVRSFWKKGGKAPAKIWSANYDKSNLKITAGMSNEYFGSRGKVSCNVTLYATESINECGVNSYIGYVKLVGKIDCGNKSEVVVTEQHDLKIVDLSFPFLDKYVLFVKSFCNNINDNDKNFVLQGIKSNKYYSFVYFGNRNYPACNEYKNSKDKEQPPVLLDLFFNADKALLGSSFKGAKGFDLKDKDAKKLSKDNFFITGTVPFRKFSGNINTGNYPSLYVKVGELLITYVGLYEQCRQVYTGAPGLVTSVVHDYINCEGDIVKSGIFKDLLEDLFPIWEYYYGYTDYNHIGPNQNADLGKTPPFNGLTTYFEDKDKNNFAKYVGGAMPAIFGEDRKTPVYVEGPVFVRFFKIGLLDEATVYYEVNTSSFDGTKRLPIHFPAVACKWENTKSSSVETFAGKDVGGRIDSMSKRFMSHPVESLSINNFFFGAGENSKKRDNTLGGGIQGYDVFHYLDKELRTVSCFYNTAEDFINDRVKKINNEKILDLDGISVIYGKDTKSLDLSDVKKYRGKGMIVSFAGDCNLGNLLPSSDADYLKIWLMLGHFRVNEDLDSANIQASLISTVEQSDNSSSDVSREGGFFTNKVKTHIMGNLVIDSLFDIRDKSNFKVTHDPRIYSNEYPVRVSVGGPKSVYQLEYKGAK